MGILFMAGENLMLPPIAANDPILAWIWGYISMLYHCSPDDRHNAVNELLSLSRDSYRNNKLIVHEGGVVPLLKLLKEGRIEDQVIAAKTIGTLGCDSETTQLIIDAGVSLVFAKILKEGAMEVQAEVAWAISQLVAKYPQCGDIFAQHNIIRLLVEHLAFETDHVQNVVVINKATSVLALVMAKTRLDMRKAIDECNDDKPYRIPCPHQPNSSLAVTSFKGGDLEDPNVKSRIKGMVARALHQLAKSDSSICCSIAESRAMTSFVVLLEEGTEDVQHSSAMALMEITAVAEQDTVLRRSAFRPSSPACKAVVDQLVKVVERQSTHLLIPCVKAIGNLARTFRVTETRIIAPLVELLYRNEAKFSEDPPRSKFIGNTRLRSSFTRLIRRLGETEAEICREALMALRKFACHNHLQIEHSQAIVDVGGVAPIIQLVDSGDEMVQIPALILLCNIALHVPNGEGLVRAYNLIEWASKQGDLTQNEMLQTLIPEAKGRLEIYHTCD